MIEKQQIFPMLLQACPSYLNRYKTYIEQNYEIEEERLLYVDIGDFTAYMIECYAKRKTDELDEAFDAIERMLVHGDSYVQDFAVVGILETLQNQLLDKGTELSEFEPLLQAESRAGWRHLIDFWDGKVQ